MLIAVTTCLLSKAVRHFEDTHSRHPKPRSFWSAPRIATSCRARSSEHGQSIFVCVLGRSIRFVRFDGKSVNHFLRMGDSEWVASRLVVLTKRSAARLLGVSHMRCYDIFLVSLPTGTKFSSNLPDAAFALNVG